MQPRSLALVALALAATALAGMALTTGGWTLGLGALAVASGGAFGGLLDGEGRAPRRTILLLGTLVYLVIVPVLGFVERALAERGGTSGAWWVLATLAVLGLLAAFFGARRWQHEHGEVAGRAVVGRAT